MRESSFSPSNRNAASLTAGTGGGTGGTAERESGFRGTERKKRARTEFFFISKTAVWRALFRLPLS